ncbi:MAG: aspartate carbamoyltransferase catalytic subunit [Lactobacillus sp.]|jgi:aspartate carbamoyltransferase catalytic subunit|nr:aspartate carbamoyltransferase catalytic subunit [Lactobacillus sp.]
MSILKKQNFVTVADLTPDDVMDIVLRSQAFKRGAQIQLKRPVYAINLFFENSTRTHTSFEMAEEKLGLHVLSFDAKTSSVSKGESLHDTVKTVESIGADIAVIRHSKDDYYEDLIQQPRKIAIANAGDGAGQHPSQCLLDMMTIYEEFGHFRGLTVGIAGDLAHSRVARSNMMLLKKLGVNLVFCAPDQWYDAEFDSYGTRVEMDELVQQVDVLMLLRVQHERLTDQSNQTFSKETYHAQYGLTHARAKTLKPTAIIMHPAPVNRGVEIASDLVECSQSRIFEQMTNGVYTRMTILESLLAGHNLLMPQSSIKIGVKTNAISY